MMHAFRPSRRSCGPSVPLAEHGLVGQAVGGRGGGNGADALAASVRSGHASDELPKERGHAHCCPVGGHGGVLVRRISHEHLRAIIGRVCQRPTGLPVANPREPTRTVCTWGWRRSWSSWSSEHRAHLAKRGRYLAGREVPGCCQTRLRTSRAGPRFHSDAAQESH